METKIIIQNLKCGGCANTVTKNLMQLDGVSNVMVDVEESSVTLNYENENCLNEVKSTLNRLGYPEDGEANSLTSKAKSYVSCAVGKVSK
ncbi:MAG: heavy-metal-associated domain-containing protein [Flavobacteriaceae bacterium]|nr:heavy-metal-associated domain-containing protein [Flavobacteriaceae bacterium]